MFRIQIMDVDVCDTIKENHQCFDQNHTGGMPVSAQIDDTPELNYPQPILDTLFIDCVAQ